MAVVFVLVAAVFVTAMIGSEYENGGFSTRREDNKGAWIVIFEDGSIETYDSYKEANERYNSCAEAIQLGINK